MKEDIEELVELLFQHCYFDPVYMNEEFARQRYRCALENLSDEEYEQIKARIKNNS